MGLWERYKSFFSGPEIDLTTELGAQLPAGDDVLAHTGVIPSAYERGGGGGLSVTGRVLNAATSAVENAVSTSQHVGGGTDAVARRLPQEAGPHVLVLGTLALTVWDLGLTMNQTPAELLATVPRAQVDTILDTGATAQGGVPVARLTFTDGSFFDYRLVQKPGDEFWSVASAY
ncbi:hypothetical protein [Cellulomonas sp. RIT-PI-Y]|uniref:hypothetical protein n=1 Tax=Cellulomonas sp. RIT-PI-Y TaxID=3035297 RepID=UPI0021DA6A15|nr:hypothetical protein [Cellulomonas sp. RIT-PI-Y]